MNSITIIDGAAPWYPEPLRFQNQIEGSILCCAVYLECPGLYRSLLWENSMPPQVFQGGEFMNASNAYLHSVSPQHLT